MFPYLTLKNHSREKRIGTSVLPREHMSSVTQLISASLLSTPQMSKTKTAGDLLLRKIERMAKIYESEYFGIKVRSPKSRIIYNTFESGTKEKRKRDPKRLDNLSKTNPLSREVKDKS